MLYLFASLLAVASADPYYVMETFNLGSLNVGGQTGNIPFFYTVEQCSPTSALLPSQFVIYQCETESIFTRTYYSDSTCETVSGGPVQMTAANATFNCDSGSTWDYAVTESYLNDVCDDADINAAVVSAVNICSGSSMNSTLQTCDGDGVYQVGYSSTDCSGEALMDTEVYVTNAECEDISQGIIEASTRVTTCVLDSKEVGSASTAAKFLAVIMSALVAMVTMQ